MLRDVLAAESPDIVAASTLIAQARADVIVLQGMDYDLGMVALGAFRDRVSKSGMTYPHMFSARPNSGLPLGLDVDGDGRPDGPRDTQGYGRFGGAGGMAVLSRWPITLDVDLTEFLWRDLPDGLIATDDPAHDIQRLSSVAHWVLDVAPEGQRPMKLMTFHATPPVFDGPEDRNGRRNHDEAALWLRLLDGSLEVPPPQSRFVVLGDFNMDPADGDGRSAALLSLLAHPELQDVAPQSQHARDAALTDGGTNTTHRGDPAHDTANWRDDPGPGNLRVDYVLPSNDWDVTGSGVLWSEAVDGDFDDQPVLRHGLVWVDLR
ncbi:MAG: endonuclease/exonuclease/phosphatase family protein [Pseudomonadota bacterium]